MIRVNCFHMIHFLLPLLVASATISPISKDTLLVHDVVPSIYSSPACVDEEYYLISGKDTSFFSCVVTIDEGVVTTLKVECENRMKLSRMEKTDSSLSLLKIPSVTYMPISFDKVISTLGEILNDVCKKYKMSDNLKVIIDLGDLGDESIRINEAFRKTRRQNEYNTLKIVLKGSNLYNEINNILGRFRKTIVNIEIEEIHFISREMFLSNNKISVENKVPKQIVSCCVYFSVESENTSSI